MSVEHISQLDLFIFIVGLKLDFSWMVIQSCCICVCHPSLIKWPNWRNDWPSRRHSFLESTGQGQWKSGTKAGLGLWTFLLEAKMSSDEARTLEFWNAVLHVSRALPKVKNSSYGLFWVFNEKSAKAMIFWKWRPVGSLHSHTKWPKKDVSGWNFQKPIIYS